MRYLLPLIFLLAGCDKVATIEPASEMTIIRATCAMNDFDGFPKKVTGIVTLQLKGFLTIRVDNEDNSEHVEITFPKSKCGVK